MPPEENYTLSASLEITRLLQDWSNGDEQALEKLTPVLYKELHRMAHRYMRQERPGHTLQTTALINEAYLRLIGWKNVRWQNRAQFFGVSAQLMRKILVDFARSRNYAKRGPSARLISIEQAPGGSRDRARDILALDDALKQLAAIDPRKSQIVELRFFGGLSLEETAEILKVSSRTIRRDWELAKVWLGREMNAETAR
jgi:RNA polymerase sigma factor (TIGR02999 family)